MQAMHEELLTHLLTNVPHVNHRVADDWLGNTISICRHEADNIEEILSDGHFEDLVRRRVEWHINHLKGFGGSDMAVLYTEFNGGYYPHEASAKTVVATKLCMETPTGATGDTERGIRTEPEARRKFLKKMKKYGLKVYNEAYEALRKLNENGGVPGHEWMSSSPDGIYIDSKGEVWLVDFKTPASQDTVEEMVSNPPDYYRAQLAHYKYHLEAAGVKIDHVALVPFSTKNWDVEIAEFTITQDLTDDVIKAGDYYWNEFVLKNKLPELPPSENFQYVGEMPRDLQRSVARFILEKKLMSNIKSMNDRTKIDLLERASLCGINWNQPDMKTRIPGVDISNKPKVTIDYQAIASDFRESSGNPDDEKYKKVKDSTTVSVIRGKKNAHAPFIEELNEMAERAIDFALEDMMEQYEFLPTKSELDSLPKDPSSPMYEGSGTSVKNGPPDNYQDITNTEPSSL